MRGVLRLARAELAALPSCAWPSPHCHRHPSLVLDEDPRRHRDDLLGQYDAIMKGGHMV